MQMRKLVPDLNSAIGVFQRVFRKFQNTFGRLHYVKSVRILSFSGPYLSSVGLNTEKYVPEKL